jgi:hypothetical protein
MLAMDKLSPKLDRDYPGVVVSVDSSAYAVAGFDEDYLSASHREIACSSQACGPGTKYQDRLFARHACNCNDQTTEWVSNPKGCEIVASLAAKKRLTIRPFLARRVLAARRLEEIIQSAREAGRREC